MYKVYFIISFIFLSHFSFAQITVTDINIGTQLAQNLVGNGVSISNVTFSAANGSCGKFTSINSPIIMDSGIVMTNGFCNDDIFNSINGITGSASNFASSNNGAAGDASLTALSGHTTYNASILEFDFVPLGDTIKFNYQFSSEEYTDFTCDNYNDVFAFFINGPGIIGTKNMAIIPNTNPAIPVTINTINSGVPGPGGNLSNCTVYGQGSPYTSLFINNLFGNFLTHDGLTKKLTAVSKVIPCQTYHLKIAIADAEDELLDSGVFIESNSLNSNIATCQFLGSIDPSTNSVFLAEGCVSGSLKFTIPSISSTPTVLNLSFAGTATNGVDINLIPSSIVIPANTTSITLPLTAFSDGLIEGTEILKVYISSSCGNNYLDSSIIQIRDFNTLVLTPADSVRICNGSSIQLTASAGFTTYTWDANTTLNNTNIANPIATPLNNSTYYYCTATLGTCQARDSVLINKNTITLLSKVDINCKDGATGIIKVSPGLGWVAPLQFSIDNGINQSDSAFYNLTIGSHLIKVMDNAGCTNTITVILAQAFPDLNFTETVVNPSSCNNSGTINITATGGKSPYLYSLDGIIYISSNILTSTTSGTNVVYVKDANGCIASHNVLLANNNPLLITNTQITSASCSGNADGVIVVTASGGVLPYLFSSNGGLSFQTSNVLLVANGSNNIIVKDNANCTVSSNVNIPINNNLILSTGGNKTICEGKNIVLNATATAGSTILWTPNFAITNPQTLTPTVSPTVTTKYFITINNGICTKSDSVTVTVNPAPIPNAGLDSVICYGKSIQLQGSGGTIYNWLPNYNISNINIASPTITPYTTVKYWLTTEDAFGCKSLFADTVKITVTPPLYLNAGNDTAIAQNQPLQLNATGAPFYVWSPTTWLNNNTISNPVAIISNLGYQTYYLKGYTAKGCIGFDTIKINVFKGPEIYVPNIFTPNNDGHNDKLHITVIGFKSFTYFRIYNRWGQLVFETNNPNIDWNGAFKSDPQSNGNFVWMAEGISYLGNKIFRQGSVLLLR